ncbi:MAG: head GIN domain-containing protein, partial [Anaerolineae bacterium]
ALIKTTVRNGVLVIEFERPAITFNAVTRIEYDITVRNLASLEINGAGDTTVSNLNGGKFKVKVSGAGNIVASGKVTTQDINLTGAGRYDASDLQSENAVVEINGAGSATVWASKSLDASISGLGDIKYYGSPQVTKHISGVGSVDSLGSK